MVYESLLCYSYNVFCLYFKLGYPFFENTNKGDFIEIRDVYINLHLKFRLNSWFFKTENEKREVKNFENENENEKTRSQTENCKKRRLEFF